MATGTVVSDACVIARPLGEGNSSLLESDDELLGWGVWSSLLKFCMVGFLAISKSIGGFAVPCTDRSDPIGGTVSEAVLVEFAFPEFISDLFS